MRTRSLLFLADFDGEFGPLMLDLARRAGPLFDVIFEHVSDPPPAPVANNADAFVEWAADHLLNPAYVYSAYPGPTVKEIKALAAAADVAGASQLLPFLVILPARSRLAYAEMQLILRTMGMTGKVDKDMDSVGTPHFAQFVPLEDQQLGFFTVYDGAFDKYIMDFTKNIGEVFDVIFKFTKDPPPSPCRKYVQEFIDFAAGIAVLSTGSTHPKVVEAIKRQSEKFVHFSYTDFYYDNLVELSEKLLSLIPGDFAKMAYYGNSGAEAIEARQATKDAASAFFKASALMPINSSNR